MGPMQPSAGSLLGLLLLLSSKLPQATAFPFSRQENHEAGYAALMPRQCAMYCGWSNSYCCGEGTNCVTANGIASCSAKGGFGVYTTTWTETRTFTSTITPIQSIDTTATCVPQNPGEKTCGWICCASWQYCAYNGQCAPLPGVSEPVGGATQTIVITTNGVVTTQFSAPYRVTSATVTGVFTSGASTAFTATTTTTTSATAIGATGGGTGSSLSGGAIAGIVIGVLVGISLLLLLCFCCIARGIWNALCGGSRRRRNRERERVEVVDERYSRHGSRVASAHSRRTRHTGWFGLGGGGGSDRDRREKRSSGAGWLGLAGGALTLLALLNLTKDKKRPARKERSSYSGSYYTASHTSPSELLRS
jgi:hypothetical protein